MTRTKEAPGHHTTAVQQTETTPLSGPLTVDYGRDQTAAMTAGGYWQINKWCEELDWSDWRAPDGTTRHFPAEGVVETEVRLVTFDRRITSQEVLEELDRLGLRPANIVELLAYGEAHSGRFDFSITALGSIWKDPRQRLRAADLWSDVRRRYIVLSYYDEPWPVGYRFLAVPK